MAAQYILAIDQGTTGTKALVFNHDAQIVGQAYAEFTQYYPQPGWVEHDANEIWTATRRLIDLALANAGVQASEIAGIGITNQRETVVLWDRATGEPVCRAIVWQDRRTASHCDALRAQGLEPTVRAATGLVLDPYFSATKVQWLLEHESGLRERANAGDIAFGTIDSWLVWKLTGGAAHVTDYSNASRTLLYNIHELRWNEDMLRLFDVPRAMLPEVKPSSHVYGVTAPDGFFGREIPVAGIAGDQQAALFGQACYSSGQAKNTYGTGSFMLLHTGTQAVASEAGLLTTIAWRLGDAPVEYALEGSIFVTGAAVQWLRDGLGIIADAAETEALAESVSGNDGVYFVPALTGLGAPHWDAHARGAIVGITRGTTSTHLVRAALESICYQTRDVLEAMQRDAGLDLRQMRVDGGAVGNAFLMQFQADMLGVPVEVPEITETTALGAAYLAGLATGFWKDQQELQEKWRLRRRYEPRMSASDRDRLHNRWLEAVERAKAWEQ